MHPWVVLGIPGQPTIVLDVKPNLLTLSDLALYQKNNTSLRQAQSWRNLFISPNISYIACVLQFISHMQCVEYFKVYLGITSRTRLGTVVNSCVRGTRQPDYVPVQAKKGAVGRI